MSIKEDDKRYIAGMYARYDAAFVSGKGATLYDEDGKAYIDCTAGIGVNALGHGDKEWVDAVCRQAKELAHVSNLYYTRPDTQVARQLCDKTGMKKVFFANSGAEANEGAIKAARKYAHDNYGDERYEIITLINSFHGRTITTLAATGQDHFHTNFDPFTPGFQYAIANDIADLKTKVTTKTCAIMLELIQGEGGVLPLQLQYVKEVERLCKEKDLILIIDEVQTGIGRCGTLYAYQQYDIEPDIVTSAKGLGNGLPIGAVLLNDKVQNVFGYGDHGTTFGGNPVACAGANIVLSKMNQHFFDDVVRKGNEMSERLLAMKHIQSVQGLGLMRGAALDHIDAKDVVQACLNKGLLLLTAKDKLRFLPPLTILDSELNQAMDILEDVLEHWKGNI